MRFIQLFLVVMVTACATSGGPNTAGGWYALEKARSMDCELWPDRREVLETYDVRVIRGKATGLLSSVRLRNGKTSSYYVPFEGDADLDPQNMIALEFGHAAVPLGGGNWDGRDFVAVARATNDRAMEIEFRQPADNVVLQQLANFHGQLIDGTLSAVRDGFWLAYSPLVADADTSGTESSTAILYINAKPTLSSQPEKFAGLKFSLDTRLLPDAEGQSSLLVWSENAAKRGTASQAVFYAKSVSRTGQVGPSRPVDLAVEDRVESWSALREKNSIYLAFVDGDSIVGRARLVMAELVAEADGTMRVARQRAVPLMDVHVSEPFWVVHEGAPHVLFTAWLDDESTIIRQSLEPAVSDSKSDSLSSGRFAQGSRIIDAFEWQDKDISYLLMKSKEKDKWVHRICEFTW